MNSSNIFSFPSVAPKSEVFDALVSAENVRIERIVSNGHSSPEDYWYDLDENEWVIILHGTGTIEFYDGTTVTLKTGDYLNIPAHSKHKVTRTDPDRLTIWLAVFYS